MSRTPRVAVVLPLCTSVAAGCGGSHQFSPAERAAIRAAQRQDSELRIFSSREAGPISCDLGVGGRFHITNGHCMTFVSLYGNWPVIDFIEQYHLNGYAKQGGFLVVLNPQERIVSEHRRGLLPQDFR